MSKPRPGYIFTPEDCPNADHPFKHQCGLCGVYPSAYRLGQNLAKGTVAVGAVAVVSVLALLLGGCAATTPEDEFVRDVRAAASANGYPWSDELEQEALALGEAVCRDLDDGRTLDSIRDEVIAQAETPQAGRVILAAVDAAPETLCEGS
ncbi:membrane protein [Microbacterium phage DelaGarza]|nr:membrane protein [Microbacterium phage DelaGarza]